jgi:hypothetical protein
MAKKVRCHLKTLFAPQVSETKQLANVTMILGSFGITVELISGESLSLPAYNMRTYPVVGVDCRLNQVTSQQEDLFAAPLPKV